MARKRYNEEDILRLLREIEMYLHGGIDVVSAGRTAGISGKTYHGWHFRLCRKPWNRSELLSPSIDRWEGTNSFPFGC